MQRFRQRLQVFVSTNQGPLLEEGRGRWGFYCDCPSGLVSVSIIGRHGGSPECLAWESVCLRASLCRDLRSFTGECTQPDGL